MAGSAVQSALLLNEIILNECAYHEDTTIFTGRERFKMVFIKRTGRKISMSTLARYIHILTSGGFLKRWQERLTGAYMGRRFQSAKSVVTKKGLIALEKALHPAFDIVDKIKAAMKAEKETAPFPDEKGAREGSAAPLGAVIKKIIKLPETR